MQRCVTRFEIYQITLLFVGPILISGGMLHAAGPDFNRDVAPILIRRCLECHYDGKKSGGLDLSEAKTALAGGESGKAIAPGKIEESLLIDRIAAGEMPPQEEKENSKNAKKTEPVTPEELKTLREWIAAGGTWPEQRRLGLHEKTVDLAAARRFWSFQPLQRPAPPSVQRAALVANPIDAFWLKKLEEAKLEPAAEALPRDLLRRAWLDLVGLPPSIEEQERFLKAFAESPQTAYAQLVEQLLANPGYGERWGRHWLDLVRYADSNGYERDAPKPNVWRYRDYVIDSLNADKPYDRFALEQLAGDELPDASAETVIATGFYALGTWQDEVDPLEQPQYRADEVDDLVKTTSQTFLGITLGCARCHNHKFDPLTMADYYSMAAILSPLKRPNMGRTDGDRPAGTKQQLAALAARDKKIAERRPKIEAIWNSEQATWLEVGKSKLPPETIAAFKVHPGKRSPEQRDLADKNLAALRDELRPHLLEVNKKEIERLEGEIAALIRETPDLPRGYYLFEDSPKPPPTFLLQSGRAGNPGPEMLPAVPAVLAERQPEFPPPDEFTSRRRLAFAKWVASPENRLTARVIVNRVWQHHFGAGLAATPSDLGAIGARPTHPELLDWLAHWFSHDAGWSMKKLHRLIMTSRAYRTGTAWNEQGDKTDVENKLLWRFPQRRLEAEIIRDCALAVSGELNRTMHGPAVYLPIPEEVLETHTDKQNAWKASSEPDINRRTIYSYTKRTLLVPMLEVLDLCDTSQSADMRNITHIAPQALTLYNGRFVNQQAEIFAHRVLKEAGSESGQQIVRAYLLALCRPPEAEEAAAMKHFLSESAGQFTAQQKAAGKQAAEEAARRFALTQLCRAILNLNEFVYPN